ncbi:PREDICTED: cyclin-dependent kinases regulatory subunit 1 isoform X1 [Mandrillus leucophaeus]|uniref:Cyclin-dependent kinases regulatory subunit n=1 Tax=Theropithecus gelada TaxID=9565 RepID=A0A8D2FXZ8_THEGE|nr:PREDICTED: cyclin-dependent kinases regulatory subunit 1 isoform X1 [Mandrillus leucophaeus]XP_025261377.1 cyclin-dependent kinases regulatory subunit 1 isoform X1 [Theropithecus gelada]
MSHKQIYYSDKYDDEEFEYRHVMLPKDIAKLVPKTHLMSESEWRNLGVQQSQGWVHYMIHEPDFPHSFRTSHLAVPAPTTQEAKEMKLASYFSASSFTQLSLLPNIFLIILLCCLLVSHFDI